MTQLCQRKAYHAYHLPRSLVHSWSLKTIVRYIKLMLKWRKWQGIQDDSAQLGGDFIIDSSEHLSLVHPSHDPTDRPSADELLEKLKQLMGS